MLDSALPEDFKLPKRGEHARVDASVGASDAATLASLLLTTMASCRLLIVIVADTSDAVRLLEELTWFIPEAKGAVLPDWETLPYDLMSPHEALVSERLETLWKLSNRSKDSSCIDLLIVSASCAAFRLAPLSYTRQNTFFYSVGDSVNFDVMKRELVTSGYERVEQVVAQGEFSVRGEILDLFPMGSPTPYRLGLFDQTIESIRIFDPDSQRSLQEVKRIRILPGHEFAMDEASLNRFRERWRTHFETDPSRCPVYVNSFKGIATAGIEYYLPLFFEETSRLTDYLPEDALVVTLGDIEASLNTLFRETTERYEFLRHDAEHPALPPTSILQSVPEFFEALSPFARIRFSFTPQTFPDLTLERKAQKPLAKLERFISECRLQGKRVLVLASGEGKLERLRELLTGEHPAQRVASYAEFLNSTEPLCLCPSNLSRGFALQKPSHVVITESEIYLTKATPRRLRRERGNAILEAAIRDIAELTPGDAVVHAEHGIGRYAGLETIETREGPSEFLRIDYAKGAKLFVPVAQLHLIGRYTGADPEQAPLYALGANVWEKTKRKAAQKARDTAAELLNLYAIRASRQGFRFEEKTTDYEAFCEGFEFEETPDQAEAIRSVLADLTSGKSMDRLVCGDVGFGKTEVALRAAFVAAMNGRQVAVLCPTTLLAEQHALTFLERFAAWPVKVASLSRFRNNRETTQTLQGLAEGTVDIVIGTHKLLSEAVTFNRLGLVIIDEEHRFGVRQKEKLKALRAEVDILTLTATPIPRTLSMSLEGIRDYSVIATAPEKRLPIKTFVRRETDEVIREAVLREIKRGGQVYFLHNEVETIANRLERLEHLLPEARIGIAHGQMPERELEATMRDFYKQRFNVLLCSTIIENGIDVPNANTIIMHRADRLGLAQLHQLRGRAGRSHHQAYAYLLTPGEDAITKNAQKRLEAIQNLEDLGSGFYLSMYDLEIRGAGEILGEEQSGEISEVGFELYTEMLQNAVEALKNGREPSPEELFSTISEINLHIPALLPEDYVHDVASRLSLYKRLATVSDIAALESLVDELGERFGRLPEAALSLIATHRLRLYCKALGIRKLEASADAIVVTFDVRPAFDPVCLVRLLQSRRDMRLMANNKLQFIASTKGLDDRMRAIRVLLNPLLTSLKTTSM